MKERVRAVVVPALGVEGRVDVNVSPMSADEGVEDNTEVALPVGSGWSGYCGEWVVTLFLSDVETAADQGKERARHAHSCVCRGRGFISKFDRYAPRKFTAVLAPPGPR